jgi:hypothetical protein
MVKTKNRSSASFRHTLCRGVLPPCGNSHAMDGRREKLRSEGLGCARSGEMVD